MCGILAYYKPSGISRNDLNESLAALKRIKHRGPDGEGVVLINTKSGEFKTLYTEETPKDISCNITTEEYTEDVYDLFLGHRRLSIFDLSSKGFQPMTDKNGNWIIFNGEIYNFLEIREELKQKGYSFKTNTDTEVILAAYDCWAEACLPKFNGMWSIVIWDTNKKQLFVSNDRYGVKPLYYLYNEDELMICSEQKQLLEYRGRIKAYNIENFKIFLEYGFLDFDHTTFFNEIFRFKSAHYSNVDLHNKSFSDIDSPISYYSLPEKTNRNITEKNAIEEFRFLLSDAVKIRLRADVPFAFALSGGLDSSAILYTANKLLLSAGYKERIKSFSAIFPNMEGDESVFMKIIENELNLDATYVQPINEFSIEDLKRHIYHQDGPVQSTSYYAEWALAKNIAKRNIKILIVGQGADEIFAGYHHHFYCYCRSLILKGEIIKYLTESKKYATLKGWKQNKIHAIVINEIKLAIKFKLAIGKIDNTLLKKINNASKLSELLNVDFTESTLPVYLKSDDRDGMAHGIESRHPFLDFRLVNFGFSLPDHLKIKNGWQKYIIRSSMQELPIPIRYRKDKKGFTTPQDLWVKKFKQELEVYRVYTNEYRHWSKDLFRDYSLGIWLQNNSININDCYC